MQKLLSFILSASMSLTAYSQCADFAISSNKTSVCAPELVNFEVLNTPANCSYEWNTGNGWVNGSQSSVALYSTADTIDISVRITLPSGDKCTLTENSMIVVREKPIAIIDAASYTLCNGPEELTFTDNSSNSVSRNWIIDGTNYNNAAESITHKFTNTGTKSISLVITDSYGCQGVAQFIDTIKVYPNPEINFSANKTRGCVPQEIELNAQAPDASDYVYTYLWTLEGTSTATATGAELEPLTYNTAGTFNVSLTANADNGCTYVINKVDYLQFAKPQKLDLTFSNTEVCINSAIPVTLASTAAGTTKWAFSGISMSNEEIDAFNRNVYPQESGTLNITLTNNTSGCKSAKTFSAEVITKAVEASFTSDDNYHCLVPHTVHLQNTSKKLDATELQYIWNIYAQDSLVHSATSINDSMTFNLLPASYDVELIVSGDNGCTDTLVKKGYIYQDTMNVNFTALPEIGCIGQEIEFKNNSKASTYVEEDEYKWTFYGLDGSVLDSSTEKNASMVYGDTGIYVVQLIGYNSLLCTDTFEFDGVQIIDPQISFSVTDHVICHGESFEATATTTPLVTTMEHNWLLAHHQSNKKQTYKGINPTIKPALAGSYTLTYSFKIIDGCYQEDTMTIFVNGTNGTIALDSMQGCAPFILEPTYQATYNYHYGTSNSSFTYDWKVNPNAELAYGQSANPIFTLNEDGFYTLGLSATNAAGCTVKTQLRNIQAGVIAKLSVLDKRICLGDTLVLTNRSRNAHTTYTFDVANYTNFSTTAMQNKTGLVVADSGKYTVRLIAKKDGLCSDTVSVPFEVIQVIADFASNDTFLKCAPVYVQFENKSINHDSLYWDFGDGQTYATTEHTAGTIYQENTVGSDGFDVRLVATNKEGCSDTTTKIDFVQVQGPLPLFTMVDYTACETTEVVFTNLSKGGSNTIVDYMDGSPLDNELNKHVYTKSTDELIETFYPTIYVSDDNGCVAEYKTGIAVTLYATPQTTFELPDLSTACAPYQFTAQNKTVQDVQLKWYINQTLLSEEEELDVLLRDYGQYNVQLTTTNEFGCTDSLQEKIAIQGVPSINLQMNDSICLYNTLNFKAVIGQDNFLDTSNMQINWNFGEETNPNNLSNDKQTAIAYALSGDKKVSLTVSLANGCSDEVELDLHLRGSEELDQPEVDYLSFTQGYTLELHHEASTDENFASYHYRRSDGAAYSTADQQSTSWTNDFVSIPDSSLCYDINIKDQCDLSGLKSRKHCFIYLTISSTENFQNALAWSHYIGWDKISQYRVYRRIVDQTSFELIASVPGSINSFLDKGLCSENYEYYVQAVNANGDEKSNSFKVSHKPVTGSNTLKSSIANASVVNEEQIEVRWNTSVYARFDHFELNKYNENMQLISTEKTTATRFKDYDVDPANESYIYTVQEVDICGVANEAGRIGKTILLEANYDNNKHQSALNWSAYQEWQNGVDEYVIRLASEEGITFIGYTSANDTAYTDKEYHSTLNGAYCYQVVAVNTSGDSSYSNTVCVNGDPISYIPNAFSPNQDGLNDLFRPTCRFVDHLAEVNGYEMEIYNRWGEKIFQSNDLINGWDGTYDYNPCMQGVYVYKIKYKGIDGIQYNHSGTVTLVK